MTEQFSISGDIAQPCDGTERTYFESTEGVKMVVNVFNASSSCDMTATLKNLAGTVLISTTIKRRVNVADLVADPGSSPPGQFDVVNQQKTLAAEGVAFLTISCSCSFTGCSTSTECSGRYEGEIVF